jgi:hypothetical protein
MVTLFGCKVYGCAVPFPNFNFELLTANEQHTLVTRGARRGFRWDLARYPVKSEDQITAV